MLTDEAVPFQMAVGDAETAELVLGDVHDAAYALHDMHRRMGDLRDSAGQANGLWTRIYNGKASFGGQSIENKYTAFQFGYDHQVSPGLWMGGALSYTYGDNDFAHGEGDNSLLAFTAYASRLFDNGLYLDFTGKVGRMKNSFDIRVGDIRSSGDYHTNAVSVSAEAGWRFDVMKNVFFEPQVEVWYGHVFDAQYQTSTNVDVDQASTDSLVGRAGFRLGLECPNNRGTAFIKASVLHDWEGEADFRFSKGGVPFEILHPVRHRSKGAAVGTQAAGDVADKAKTSSAPVQGKFRLVGRSSR